MRWQDGYTATYYAEIVDQESWRGIRRIELEGGKINRIATGLRESADLDCREPIGEKYIRVWLDVRQGSGGAHVPLFTGLTSQPDIQWNGTKPERGLVCYSVLQAADDVGLLHGWYAPAGANAGVVIRNLLDATPAPVQIIGETPNLEQSIIAEDNETRATMVDKILLAIGWRMRILGDGTIQICKQADAPMIRFNPIDFDIIEPEVKVKDDWYRCPNVYTAQADDLVATVRDDSPNSPLSTVNRGRVITMFENNADLNDNESIGQYAWRRLKEEQAYAFSVDYNRRYIPDILVGDMVNLNYPIQGIVGNYKVLSQTIQLGYHGNTAEEVYAV